MEPKKNENRDITKFRTLFGNVGLVITLVLTITAFEWKWEEVKIIIPGEDIEIDSLIYIPVIEYDLPPAPEPPMPESKVDLTNPTIVIDNGVDAIIKDPIIAAPTIDISKLITTTSAPDEPVDMTIFNDVQVSEQATPTCNWEVWYKSIGNYCASNRKDSDKLRTGKVHVSFIIEKDGSISNIKVLKGVHKRIDALAIRSIKNSGDWKSAKMGVRKVRQQLIIPISFE